MNKTARRADYLAALLDFRRVGISTYASVIIGFPGETEQTVSQTESLRLEGRPDFFRAQLWYADPVTPIWERRTEFGVRGRGFSWRHSTMTSAQACQHIGRLFHTIDDPIWMPQFGFEQWSVFYLLRQGMTMGGVKEFVRAFNAVVRHQVRHPDQQLESAMLDRLRRCSQFPDAELAA